MHIHTNTNTLSVCAAALHLHCCPSFLLPDWTAFTFTMAAFMFGRQRINVTGICQNLQSLSIVCCPDYVAGLRTLLASTWNNLIWVAVLIRVALLPTNIQAYISIQSWNFFKNFDLSRLKACKSFKQSSTLKHLKPLCTIRKKTTFQILHYIYMIFTTKA